jgi:3,4-dihydroxy 2-butanone 4-phosphate synthase/GTP cyclohydrolase II
VELIRHDLFRDDPAEARIRDAIAAVAAGRPVIVVDDADRKNEGDLVFAATAATPALVAFTVRHTSGFVCVALPDEMCDRLGLHPMRRSGGNRFGTAYQVAVDLRGTGTGISATARAATIAALGSPTSTAADFARPGHVVPLRARPGGVLTRPGHTEAAVDLVRLAGPPAAGALSEIVSKERPGEMAHGAELERFAKEHDLVLISVAELVTHRRHTESQVRRVVETSLPTAHGPFTAVGYVGEQDGAEHLALVAGPVDPTVPVHVHVECLSGDVMRSTGCNCRHDLDEALERLAARRRGIIVYLRPAGPAHPCAIRKQAVHLTAAATAGWILVDLGACTSHLGDGRAAGQRSRRILSGRSSA